MDTNEKFVITLSREIGSGGRTIGKKLAEKLGVPFCDKAVIRGLVDHFDLSAYNIEKIKGEKKNWLSDFIQIEGKQVNRSIRTNIRIVRRIKIKQRLTMNIVFTHKHTKVIVFFLF